ncbi:MAG: hypothetical protein QOJ94_2608 [Sphingomonadales bacterium]|jgi:hypothetical protein|nr:hypothetical protein [Sphingomonadales bacterium]
MERAGAEVIAFPRSARPAAPPASLDIGDLRFRALAGEEAWASLPEAVRERFGRHIGAGASILYAGEVVECRISRCGRLLAELCRLIGAPLPLSRDAFVPAVVSVTEDPASGGQFWTRLYGRRRGFPQVIHSIKRFCGPTGLEEYVGCGIGIALRLEVAEGALHFLSDHYFLSVGQLRLRLPRWLSPGRMRVSHIDCGHGSFAFVLRLDHPWLGELVCQTAMFEERRAPRND